MGGGGDSSPVLESGGALLKSGATRRSVAVSAAGMDVGAVVHLAPIHSSGLMRLSAAQTPPRRCRFSTSTAFDRCSGRRLFVLSHAACPAVCLTKRCISYVRSERPRRATTDSSAPLREHVHFAISHFHVYRFRRTDARRACRAPSVDWRLCLNHSRLQPVSRSYY